MCAAHSHRRHHRLSNAKPHYPFLPSQWILWEGMDSEDLPSQWILPYITLAPSVPIPTHCDMLNLHKCRKDFSAVRMPLADASVIGTSPKNRVVKLSLLREKYRTTIPSSFAQDLSVLSSAISEYSSCPMSSTSMSKNVGPGTLVTRVVHFVRSRVIPSAYVPESVFHNRSQVISSTQ